MGIVSARHVDHVGLVGAAHTNLSPEEIAGIPPKANKLVG
jgi:hypothetical protein